ncbi:phosphoserine aminotransferase-like [Watersipora subatra]|uniref:phosphoserine aminotransferase-like n=1 Tax=Watersipora subatra TaxID=2589382 RepID=UPI00355C77CA
MREEVFHYRLANPTHREIMSHTNHGRKLNFAPGPSALPLEVLQKAQSEMLNYNGTGVGVMEMSHRSAEFGEIVNRAISNLIDLMSIPPNYKVLFMQGGGTGQFAAVAMNLMRLKPGHTADYFVTGTWSQKAAKEAEKYGKVNYVLPHSKRFQGVPHSNTWNLDDQASYIYFCSNETIHGVEFHDIPRTNSDIPIVADMSSNILTREIDVSKYGLIYFGAQKNVGPAGVTIVIIREDLIGRAMPSTPAVLDYKTIASNNSLFNTPPCYSIYMCGLVFEWLASHGGVAAMGEKSDLKSSLLYEIVDSSRDFYHCTIDKAHRSRVNVTFRIGGANGDEALEKKFLEEAANLHMIQLKGHRSIGGIRASLYNAVPVEHTLKLADFMRDFQRRFGATEC